VGEPCANLYSSARVLTKGNEFELAIWDWARNFFGLFDQLFFLFSELLLLFALLLGVTAVKVYRAHIWCGRLGCCLGLLVR
ncbi:hypothetical protein A2U01_0088846, partial [Trifolium medium]|nr:hypothetical protein [Trifolium medium]